MSGTAVTACVNAIATGTLYTTAKLFVGAQYQSVAVTLSYGTTTNAIAQSARIKAGNENFDALSIQAGIAVTYPTITTATSEGIVTGAASNFYWDFM